MATTGIASRAGPLEHRFRELALIAGQIGESAASRLAAHLGRFPDAEQDGIRAVPQRSTASAIPE